MLIVVPLPKCGTQEGGLREQHMDVIFPRVGVYIHSGLISLIPGGEGGKGWAIISSKCRHCSSH